MLDQDNVELIVNGNKIKFVGNFEGVIETTVPTVINGDRKFKFLSGLSCSSGKNYKKSNQFVTRGFVVKVTTKVTDFVLER